MKKQILAFTLSILLPALLSSAQAAVIVSYPETAPATNIVASYTVPFTNSFGVYNFSASNYRKVATSFATPTSSDYLVDSLTLQIGDNITTVFTNPARFSIEIWSLPSVSAGPTTPGAILMTTQQGIMQPTASQVERNDYFTFTFDSAFLAEAGKSYTFVMSIDDSAAGNILRWGIVSTADPAGSRALSSTNGGAWQNSGQTYVYYVGGMAIPEPGSFLLLGSAMTLCGFARRRKTR